MATFGPRHPRLRASANLSGDGGPEGAVQSRTSRPGARTKAALTWGAQGFPSSSCPLQALGSHTCLGVEALRERLTPHKVSRPLRERSGWH